ncbi:MAG TPA: FAD-binding oxidoreductase, partial [Thermomicrobiales bacterium]|nr:FAD-binding oxidoreductase [Thermomicrobiales bacterium]
MIHDLGTPAADAASGEPRSVHWDPGFDAVFAGRTWGWPMEQPAPGMPPPKLTRRTLVSAGGASLLRALARSKSTAPSLAAPATPAPVALTGDVIWPSDPAYDEARLDFNSRFSRFPLAVIVCSATIDVQNAVKWARAHDIPLRARSGGHSYEAYSVVDSGLVIDVSGLASVAVDLAHGEATVGAGNKLGALYTSLGAAGVTIPAGSCPGVGVAGLTLGGGIGVLSRRDGLTCDNLRAVELVDANGDLLHVSERDHSDLFWALRGGGGGNFGIATSFTFRVTPMGSLATCSASWHWTDAPAAIDAWQRWAPVVD